MKRQYRVSYYGPDGTGGKPYDPPAPDGETFGTLEAARAAIREALGGKTYGTWSGGDDSMVEAWHESDVEGCGGYAIEAQ